MSEAVQTCGNCEDCKHWNTKASDTIFGVCEQVASAWGKPLNPQSLAFAQTPGNHPARLKTWRKFGCVQFEAKD
jgi:hypothetical protein